MNIDNSEPCDEGWVDAHFVGMDCLKFVTDEMDFDAANDYCYHNSSHLIEVHTQNQMEFLIMEFQLLETLVGPRSYWGGGTDWNREGQWYWGNSLLPVEDFVWANSEPNSGSKYNYLYFFSGFYYHAADAGVNNKFYPICQKSSSYL